MIDKVKIKLAEALLRRKELNQKVDLLKQIKQSALFEVRAKRTQITDSVDDIVAQVPKLEVNQVTREYDWHAKQLRELDGYIQQTNWTCDVEVNAANLADYVEKK